MNIKLTVTLNDCEGALLRLLGTIERRGHRLRNLVSRDAAGCEQARNLTLEVDCGGRSPDVLVRQVRRLYDVLGAAWYQCPMLEMHEPYLRFEQSIPIAYGLQVHYEKEKDTRSVEAPARRCASD
jgi:acetolactate synthase regulatory subunit